MEVSINAENLFNIGPISVTNSLLTAIILIIFISISLLIAIRHFDVYKPTKFQILLELIWTTLKDMAEGIIGEKTNIVFPFLLTFFIFVIISNLSGLLPVVGTIGFVHSTVDTSESEELLAEASGPENKITLGSCLKESNCYLTSDLKVIEAESMTPLFRAPTSDVSSTIALALISVIVTNLIGIKTVGFSYLKKYFNFSNAINFFIGVLEFISEVGKILSFTFRLFGNVFAGELLLIVLTSLTFGIATLPFMGLELFFGFIQAYVFFMLTTVFVGMAFNHEHH